MPLYSTESWHFSLTSPSPLNHHKERLWSGQLFRTRIQYRTVHIHRPMGFYRRMDIHLQHVEHDLNSPTWSELTNVIRTHQHDQNSPTWSELTIMLVPLDTLSRSDNGPSVGKGLSIVPKGAWWAPRVFILPYCAKSVGYCGTNHLHTATMAILQVQSTIRSRLWQTRILDSIPPDKMDTWHQRSKRPQNAHKNVEHPQKCQHDRAQKVYTTSTKMLTQTSPQHILLSTPQLSTL